MKKFLLSLALVLGLSFASCSNHSQQSENTEVDSIEQVITVDSSDVDSVMVPCCEEDVVEEIVTDSIQ